MVQELRSTSFGEQLRREREQRGVAVETISKTTKVPVRHIMALEAGAYRDLPGGVFRRGFLRSYLAALGLDESVWMTRFEESCRDSGVREPGESGSWTVFAANVGNSRPIQRRRSRSGWLRAALLLPLLVLALAFGARVAARRNLLPYPHRWKSLKSWVDNLSSR